MEDVMSLEGPVLKVNGELVLFIPLSAGGEELIEVSQDQHPCLARSGFAD
jgi:hypothetical protein